MAAFNTEIIPENSSSAQTSTVDSLTASLAKNTVQDIGSQAAPERTEKITTMFRPIKTYTRSQILFLHNSPLVQLPPDMPELKDWFGENEPNVSKKDAEPTTPGNGRDRRFRRDAEDGELPPRPTFRSTLSQPSQMGNFKHQSLRPNDRDRDRDGEKDRQRDIRDKEGQEKLRHLSDKYDRERNKERDTAPHLTVGSSSRLVAQPTQAPAASRRAETREAAKKKAGETSEDWRRGAEPRTAREDRSETVRKDRGERERPRSRARDSSRPPRDPSSSRRDRDREREDKDRLRGDRDRDDHRRERDRDPDNREGDADDPRRWRDDGKRDERMAARRGDRHADQYRDRDRIRDREPAWDSSGDRRWVAGEERDGRSKRMTGRERKANPPPEEGKEREDRRDRDRDREKEKEPAWMDTYIPLPTGAGILGSKGAAGELDGIQAWKKGMKEKELKDKVTLPETKGESETDQSNNAEKSESSTKQLDEIQLFRLLMKREEEKKHTDNPEVPSTEPSLATTDQSGADLAKLPPPRQGVLHDAHANSETTPDLTLKKVERSNEHIASPLGVTPHSLQSILGSKESSGAPLNLSSELLPVSRMAFNHTPQESVQVTERVSADPMPSQFNPPPGSRLLAFARTPSGATKSQPVTNNPNIPLNGGFLNQGPTKSDILRPLAGFSPFEDPSQSSHVFDEHREPNNFINPNDGHRRGSAERAFLPSNENSSLQDAPSPLENGGGYSANKGSRFAKFFDGKGRENALPFSKSLTPVSFGTSSPGPGQRQDNSNYIGSHGGPTDHRAMDDIYAMLSSSAQQNHRGAPMNLPSTAPPAHASFGQQSQNNALLQHQQLQTHQQHQHQQQMHPGRLEPLYESRLNDRNFMPDGMVPGLRSAPPRSRENVGIYSDGLDDAMHFNVQRPPPHQRGADPLYSGPPPLMYAQQGGRNNNIPLQQNHYRGGPSPNQQNSLQGPQQRLPPGLANLGGRPPHEPSQFMGMPGMPSPGLHTALHLNGQGQGPFNNFNPSNNLGYGGAPQIRGPHPMQSAVGHHPMSAMGHPNNMDLRSASQAQLLGMGGANVGGLRGGFSGQGPPGQVPLLAMRQQQQLPPHMVPHLLPPHLQQQGLGGPSNQPAHDLMALLMGGSHRE